MDDEKRIDTVRSMRTFEVTTEDLPNALREQANDCTEGILKGLAHMLRYKTQDFPSVHSVMDTEMPDGSEVTFIFSAQVMPTAHLPSYGADFGETVMKLRERIRHDETK